MAVKLRRQGMRPLLVVGIYAPSGASALVTVARNQLVMDTTRWCEATGEDYAILGDWNMEEEEGAVATLAASGALRYGDDADRTPDIYHSPIKFTLQEGIVYASV